eukprot:3883607-Amphidinium_carterae.1
MSRVHSQQLCRMLGNSCIVLTWDKQRCLCGHSAVLKQSSWLWCEHSKRRGVAWRRNLHTPLLWLQSKVGDGEVEVKNIKGTDNVSDIATIKQSTNAQAYGNARIPETARRVEPRVESSSLGSIDGSQNSSRFEESPASNQNGKERNDNSETQRSP